LISENGDGKNENRAGVSQRNGAGLKFQQEIGPNNSDPRTGLLDLFVDLNYRTDLSTTDANSWRRVPRLVIDYSLLTVV